MAPQFVRDMFKWDPGGARGLVVTFLRLSANRVPQGRPKEPKVSPNGLKGASRDPPRRMHINGRFMCIRRWVHFEVQSVAKLIQMGLLWADFGIIFGRLGCQIAYLWLGRFRV